MSDGVSPGSVIGPIRRAISRPTLSRRTATVALVLAAAFTIALFMRAFAGKYGFFLNEFDPYYDYYAALHVVTLAEQHGPIYALFNNPAGCTAAVLTSCHNQQGYFYWHDITTWWPYGRNVAVTSQDGLQLTGAFLYLFFRDALGVRISLYTFLALLPVFVGSLTAIAFYLLVKRIAGTAAGLFSALMIAVSPPLIERGNLGWFKSEPLPLLVFTIAGYLFLTLFDKGMRPTRRLLTAALVGVLLGYANTDWGGALYFTAIFGLIFVLLPFLDLDVSFAAQPVLVIVASTLLVSASMPNPGVAIVTDPEGLALIAGALFFLLSQWIKPMVRAVDYKKTIGKILFGFVLGGVLLLSFGHITGVSERYLSVLEPWVRGGNPLAQSVAEEAIPTGSDYFFSYILLLFLAVFGAIVAFRRRSVPMLFALTMGGTLIYASAAYSRLLVYSSIGIALLAAVGFSELALSLAKPDGHKLVKRGVRHSSGGMKTFYSVALIILLVVPATSYWIPNPFPCTASSVVCDQSPADYGVSLANGGSVFAHSSLTDWPQALNWMRSNTPSNSVIIAWWDYGYWITVMGNRTSAADNSTINGTRIAEIGRMFMSNVTQAAAIAKGIAHGRPAYVLLYITGSLVSFSSQQQFYLLQIPSGTGFAAGGGDESKKQWFIRIGGLNESKYLYPNPDDFNLTPFALQNTLFAKMLPFTFAGFYNLGSQTGITPQYTLGQGGTPPLQLFSAPYRFQLNGGTSPFQIVFHSSSLDNPISCATGAQCFTTVMIYKVL